jgi:tRNA 2-thiouridine synthesizing protein A
MDAKPSINESRTAETLIQDMARLEGGRCSDCLAALCSHQVLMNLALGFKDAMLCLSCLAAELEHGIELFRDSLINYLQQRECYKTAWAWANRHEGVDPASTPACLAAQNQNYSAKMPEAMENRRRSKQKRDGNVNLSAATSSDAEWDAGDMGCGELVLELRLRLHAMRPGQIMKLCARDPGAPQDLPAWSRLTGHVLLRAEHPNYWIKRKE